MKKTLSILLTVMMLAQTISVIGYAEEPISEDLTTAVVSTEVAPVETPTAEPASEVTSTEEPAPEVAPTEEPTPVETPTEEPAPEVTPTEEPTPVEMPTEEPAPVETPTEESAPAETPTEEPTPAETPTEKPTPVETPVAESEIDAQAEEETEPVERDVPGQIVLALGSSATGTFSKTIGGYIYQVTTTTGGYLGVVASSSLSNLVVELYDSGYDKVYDSGTGDSRTIGAWVTAGSYYIRVISESTSGSFTVSTNFTAAGNTISGAMTERTAATLVAGASTLIGLISEDDKSDYLYYTTTSAVLFTLTLDANVTDKNSVTAEIYAEGKPGEIVATLNAANGGSARQAVWLNRGNYFIHVTGSSTGRYSINATASTSTFNEVEPNNTVGTAQKLTIDGSAITGVISTTDKVDMFVVTADTPLWVNFVVRAQMDSLKVELLDSNQKVLANVSKTGTGGSPLNAYPYAIRQQLKAGSYFLRITRNADDGAYTLSAASTLTLTGLTLSSTKVELGTSLRITTAYAGKGSVVNQKVTVYDASQKAVYETYTLASSINYTPALVGTYKVLWQLYDGTYWTDLTSKSFTVQQMTTLSMKSVTFGASSYKVGDSMGITAKTEGGYDIQQVTYTIYYEKSLNADGSLKPISVSTSKKLTFNYIPTQPGAYRCLVQAHDGKTWVYGYSAWVYALPAGNFAFNRVDLSASSVKVNEGITATLNLTGVPSYIHYYVYDDKSNLAAHSEGVATSFTFKPTTAGKYVFCVSVWNGSSWVNKSSEWFTATGVSSALSIRSITPSSTNVRLGEVVRFNLSVSGGATVGTRYTVYNSAGTQVYSWLANNSYMDFGSQKSGVYYCKVDVYDGTSWQSAKSTNVYITGTTPVVNASATLTGVKSKYSRGEAVNVKLTLSNNRTPVNTRYYICGADPTKSVWKWEGCSSNVTGWTYKAGTYRMYVEVYDGKTWTNCSSSWFTVK